MARATICIFGKPPRPGDVKTRLIHAIGAENATLIAKALLGDTIEAALQVRNVQVVISATEPFKLDEHNGLPLWIQPDGDLDIRIETTLQGALAESPCAVAIGADTPGLVPAMLEDALEQLQSHEAVIGPSEDGGYYLIGLKTCPRELFRNIRWSTYTTFHDTVAQLKLFGIKHALVRDWFDLDTRKDLDRVRFLLQSGTLAAPRLASALRLIDSPDREVVI